LAGKFKTAFPDGPPKPSKDEKEQADDQSKDQSKETQLKESKTNGVVILVADSDLLNDQVCVQVANILGYRVVRPMNGNLNLVQSFIEQRSRASLNRPFTRLREMEARAGREYENRLKELETQKQETERKISDLQSSKTGKDQKFILSPEQQKELENYQKTVADANRDLKKVRKDLRKDTDSLEFWTKVLNIGAMPAVVAVSGIVLAIYKRKRTAAR
jgi:ABC-type uncharacterized transport system involved in gliding motility auxiliary subunit